MRISTSRGWTPPLPVASLAPLRLPFAGASGVTPRAVLAAAALLAGWFLCNPYFEIDHSSLIYAGRMLADLDPSGVGSDAMFRFDGQSGFTLFTLLNRFLVRLVGLPAATAALSVTSVVAAFAGASVLALSLARGRTSALAIIYAAALPAYYGGYRIFSYAETAATPRPFAEALVLLGAAALVHGRVAWAVAAMAGAALLHPIMALPGVLLLVAWMVVADRRWGFAVAALAVTVLCACALHYPVFDRLLQVMDPAWQGVLEARSPQLFPSLWPSCWTGRAGARVATVVIAASLTRGPVRKLLLLVLAVGAVGFVTAYALNERLPLVLIVQAQTWRTLWLVFAIAPLAAAICTVDLWRQGHTARIVLALLVLSWVYADDDRVAVMLAAGAIALRLCVRPDQIRLSRRSEIVLLAGATILAVAGLVLSELSVLATTSAAPAGSAGEARSVLALDWDDTPLAALAALLLLKAKPLPGKALAVLALCGTMLIPLSWDRRSAETRAYDAGLGEPDLARLIGSRPGSVFWVGGVQEAWRWLGRANWLSPIQGAGLVFSRPLALLYQDRAQRASAAGFDDAPLADEAGASGSVPLDAVALKAFCSAADAPAWIVVPDDGAPRLPATFNAITWTAAAPRLAAERNDDGTLRWRWISRYEIAPCAAAADGS